MGSKCRDVVWGTANGYDMTAHLVYTILCVEFGIVFVVLGTILVRTFLTLLVRFFCKHTSRGK